MVHLLTRIALTIGIITTINTAVVAQKQGEKYVDSLLGVLVKARMDTNRVNLLKTISYRYSTIDPEKGILYGKEGLSLAKRIDWDKGMALANNSLATNYISMGNYGAAEEHLKAALAINETIKYQLGKAHNLRNLGIVYYERRDLKKALEHEIGALDVYRSLGDKEGIAGMSCNIGNIYLELDDLARAERNFSDALAICREINNKRDIAVNLSNLSIVYKTQGKYEQALDAAREALKVNKELGDNYGKIKSYCGLGNVYQLQRKYEEALTSFQKGYKIADEIGSKDSKGECSGKIGGCYLAVANDAEYVSLTGIFGGKAENVSLAIQYLNDGLKVSKQLNNKEYVVLFVEELSEAYALSGNYKMAFAMLKELEDLREVEYENRMATALQLNQVN